MKKKGRRRRKEGEEENNKRDESSLNVFVRFVIGLEQATDKCVPATYVRLPETWSFVSRDLGLFLGHAVSKCLPPAHSYIRKFIHTFVLSCSLL